MTGFDEQNRTDGRAFPRWLRECVRSVFFLKADLAGLHAGPWAVAVLTAALVGLGVLLQRGAAGGPVVFYWQAIASGWLSTVLMVWACWLVARSGSASPGTAVLFCMLLGQQLLVSVPLWTVYLLAPHTVRWIGPQAGRLQAWLPFVTVGWMLLAGVAMLWREASPPRAVARTVVVLVFAASFALDVYVPPMQFWYPDESARAVSAEKDKRLHLTQELVEQQSAAVVGALNALQPQRPGVPDLYAITFAPYAGEDVFRRESGVVSDVMQTNFGARGRVVELINHADTAHSLPWATGLNLQRAIHRAASLMNPEEDILFIHLTSHGARDGKLAAQFWPLEVEPITPAQLRGWLDEAGVTYRVISVSACYAGAWVPALAGPGTLVMTASDADHTSYGCGHKSELTFFGRAMYDEELRRTHSFQAAHAAARRVIEQREEEAGKTDGYSNPQISMGASIQPRLAALAAALDGGK